MTTAPAPARYSGEDATFPYELRVRHRLGLGLGLAGLVAALVGTFVPIASGEDFRLALDDWQFGVPVFVAVAVGAVGAYSMRRRPRPVAAGLMIGVGLVTAAYFGGWIADLRSFSENPGIGAILGLAGGVLIALGGTTLSVGASPPLLPVERTAPAQPFHTSPAAHTAPRAEPQPVTPAEPPPAG